MSKRTLATLGGVIAATLLIAGIAWASSSDDTSTSSTNPSTPTSLDGSPTTSLDNSRPSTSIDNSSTSTSLNGQTSTSVDDNTSTSSGNSSTSTTVDDNTSSTSDDGDDDDNSGRGGGDDNAVEDGVHTFDVAGAARVSVNVVSGRLQLADVRAEAGWSFEIDEARNDRIRIKFRNGETEAEFEAELKHGGLEVEVEAGH